MVLCLLFIQLKHANFYFVYNFCIFFWFAISKRNKRSLISLSRSVICLVFFTSWNEVVEQYLCYWNNLYQMWLIFYIECNRFGFVTASMANLNWDLTMKFSAVILFIGNLQSMLSQLLQTMAIKSSMEQRLTRAQQDLNHRFNHC